MRAHLPLRHLRKRPRKKMTVSPSKEAFLLRLEKVLLNKVRREAQNREITVTDMFVEIVESYDYNLQRQPLVKPKKAKWWEER